MNITQIQLTPSGRFRATDGRPSDAPSWYIDAAIAQGLVSRVNGRTNPSVIDYEHQTLKADRNGQPAPAAGWIERIEWIPGKGVFGQVRWTQRARAAIEAGEYRYISPVLSYDKTTGQVRDLLMAAVTNVPAIDGMAAIADPYVYGPAEPNRAQAVAALSSEALAQIDAQTLTAAEIAICEQLQIEPSEFLRAREK